MDKEWLFGKTLAELVEITDTLGAKPFVAKQIADWLYKKNIRDIALMSNLSLSFRDKLDDKYQVGVFKYLEFQESKDGTKKYLFPTHKGNYIESAYIPDKDRATLCLSSQGGCRMGCKFCMTARQGYQENLRCGDILNQIREIDESDKITNVVYMGMGEPLDNSEQVLKSIEVLTASWGYAWSPSRITLSSIGVIKGLKRYLEESKAHLTISLHSAFPEKREELMPSERTNSIDDIIKEIRKHDFAHQRRVSFGYIMFKGVNDSIEDVEQIATLLKGLHCRINLIHFHQIPDSNLLPSDNKRMVQFRDALTDRGFIATIRSSRGEDIDAACGLLSTKVQLGK